MIPPITAVYANPDLALNERVEYDALDHVSVLPAIHAAHGSVAEADPIDTDETLPTAMDFDEEPTDTTTTLPMQGPEPPTEG
jgi:hypothetical protein